jgi:hypothetical protein
LYTLHNSRGRDVSSPPANLSIVSCALPLGMAAPAHRTLLVAILSLCFPSATNFLQCRLNTSNHNGY